MRKAISPVPTPASGDGAQPVLWSILDALALCRRRYDLAANSLSVLRALISFLPKATPADGALVVWPSNRALCERADGMDERTLRRHVERLVKAGLIRRQSSSNGKRFALRYRATVISAFGFDLAPLMARSEELLAAARLERDQAEYCRALRVEILNLLHRHGEDRLDPATDTRIRRELRRRPDPLALIALRDELVALSTPQAAACEALTASDSQNDRHQQKTEKESYDSVCAQSCKPSGPEVRPAVQTQENSAGEDVTLAECLEATSESRAFAQNPVENWADMIRLADTLAPMIGIERELAEHSKRAMGPLQAAISILCIIQRSDHIQRPAAYLRRLSLLAENGQYSLKSLVRGAMRNTFAAVNQGLPGSAGQAA